MVKLNNLQIVEGVTMRDVLASAKTYLEKGWCQWTLAQDENGEKIAEFHPRACKWCSLGAIYASLNDINNRLPEGDRFMTVPMVSRIQDELGKLLPEDFYGAVPQWNDCDSRTQGEVISLFDTAIASMEAA